MSDNNVVWVTQFQKRLQEVTILTVILVVIAPIVVGLTVFFVSKTNPSLKYLAAIASIMLILILSTYYNFTQYNKHRKGLKTCEESESEKKLRIMCHNGSGLPVAKNPDGKCVVSL